jgi:hypothetical protein
MIPGTQEMRDALAGPHRRWVRVTAAGPDGAPVIVPVVEGSVELTAQSFDRAACEFTVAGLDLAPRDTGDPLAPVAGRVLVDMGVVLPGGLIESWRVADLWVQSVDIRRPRGDFTVRAVSRSARVSAAGLPQPAQPTAGETCAAFLRRIVETALGETVTHLVDAGVPDVPAPADAALAGDPWQAVEALSDLLGAETYFDRLGRLVTRPVPVIGTPAVVLAGTVTGTWVVLDRDRFANGVRLVFTGPQGETVGQAYDTVPGSPTAWDGPAGRALYEETRPGPVTQAQADAAARAMLARLVGSFQRCGADAVPNPLIEPGDTVMLRHADGAQARYLVSAVSLPLGLGEMRLDLHASLFGTEPLP